jgi:hypothetical protein
MYHGENDALFTADFAAKGHAFLKSKGLEHI